MKEIFYYTKDLITSTKIKELLKNESYQLSKIKANTNLTDIPEDAIIFLDLSAEGVFEYYNSIKSRKETRFIAFYSHVQKELYERASECGIREIIPRSKFFTKLSGGSISSFLSI